MYVEPYLFFDGRCEEALQFYVKALGAEVTMLLRYRDSPQAPPPGMLPPGWDHKVMHSSLRVGDTTVMASDGNSDAGPSFKGFSLSIAAPDTARADALFVELIGHDRALLGSHIAALRAALEGQDEDACRPVRERLVALTAALRQQHR